MIFAAFFSGRGIGVLRLLDPVPRAAPHVCHCHAQQQLDGQHRQRSPRPLPRLGYVRHRTKWKLQTVQVFNDFCFACPTKPSAPLRIPSTCPCPKYPRHAMSAHPLFSHIYSRCSGKWEGGVTRPCEKMYSNIIQIKVCTELCKFVDKDLGLACNAHVARPVQRRD